MNLNINAEKIYIFSKIFYAYLCVNSEIFLRFFISEKTYKIWRNSRYIYF